jgi:shikimate kinase
VREVLSQRDALYRETAHFTVDAACEPDEVVAQVLAAIAATKTSTILVNSASAG